MILNDICEVYSGYALKEFNDTGDGLPVIKIGNILTDGTLNLTECQFTSEKINEKYYSQKDDVYVALSGATTGKIGILKSDDRYVVNQRVGIVRKKSNEVPNEFIKYYLLRQTDRILQEAAGCAQPNISPKQLGQYVVPDYDIGKMNHIVNVLNRLTNIIKERNDELSALDELIKARFVELFGDPATNPNGWDETTIGDECFYIKDGPHKSLPDIGKENGGHPFISVRNIVNGFIDFSTARYISDEDYADAIKKCHPEKGDMLYSKGGTTGIAKLIDIDEEFANWVHVAVLKFDKSKLNGVFFENMLNGAYCYEQSQRLTKGIANRDLVLSAMAQIKMYRPPMELQEQFADFVKQVDKSKVAVQKALDEAQLLFDSLMQEYFG
jgi:type I restriction enzyme S subunit